MKYILPYTKVEFEDCLWTVLWSDGTQVCIQSNSGTECRVVKVEAVTKV